MTPNQIEAQFETEVLHIEPHQIKSLLMHGWVLSLSSPGTFLLYPGIAKSSTHKWIPLDVRILDTEVRISFFCWNQCKQRFS